MAQSSMHTGVRLVQSLKDASKPELSRNCSSAAKDVFPAPRLEGKVAVVTGGASGIGEATVRRFVKEGARVVIADIQDTLGKKLAAELGCAALFIRTDVTKEEDMAAAVDAAIALEGRLDIMFSNAGILGAIGGIEDMDMREYDYSLAVNLKGVVMGVKHAVRVMKPACGGAIVCTGSTASVQGGLGPHCYTIAKSAMNGLVRSAAFELRDYGIRINMVSPDCAATPLLATAFATFSFLPDNFSVDGAKDFLRNTSLLKGQYLTPERIADAITFLASHESAYITGQNLLIDGGRTSACSTKAAGEWFRGRQPFMREAGIRSVG